MDNTGPKGWGEVAWPGDDPSAIAVYARRLPHWRLEGAIYWVTFRLADSIPAEVLLAWAAERAAWEAAHGIDRSLPEEERRRRYLAIPAAQRAAFERQAARSFFVELDKCQGSCVLREPEAARRVADALRFYDGSRLRCGDFVVMPNHVHWLLMPLAEWRLKTLLKSIKGYSAREINRLLGRRGPIWEPESFDHVVRSPAKFEGFRQYIADNPAKARLKTGEYIHFRADC